jgi:hypothetical protein
MANDLTRQPWAESWDPFVRLYYQFGMMLGVDEFQQDQGFHLTKHRLAQRLFVGYGLLWGHGFYVDDDEGEVVVGPLFAIDELGRELWHPKPCTIKLDEWLTTNNVGPDQPIFVNLQYTRKPSAPVPAVPDPCDANPVATMPSRIAETSTPMLSIDMPAVPLDLGADEAHQFAELLAEIGRDDDTTRPLNLGYIFSRVATEAEQKQGRKTVSAWERRVPHVAYKAQSFRVIGVTPHFHRGEPHFTVRFNRRPAVLMTKAFSLEEVTQEKDGTWIRRQLVNHEEKVTPIPKDETAVRVPLKGSPGHGRPYRIVVAGTGEHALVTVTRAGAVTLGDGSDYIQPGIQPVQET